MIRSGMERAYSIWTSECRFRHFSYPPKGVKAFNPVVIPICGNVKDSLLALARYQNPRLVMFWYGFEPVVNYSVRPLASVGG
jgi:hypothetical protein